MIRHLIRTALLGAALSLCAAPGPAKNGGGEAGAGGGGGDGGDGGNPQKQQQPQQQKQQQEQERQRRRQEQQQRKQERQREYQEQKQKRQKEQEAQKAEHMKKRGDSAGSRDAGESDDNRRAQKQGDGKGAAESGTGQENDTGDKDGRGEKERQQAVDQREKNQARRIHNGVKHGQLTPDEIAKLDAQDSALSDAEAKFRSDGKLTRDESRELQKQLNDASQQIWAERHDTEGNQRSVVLLGKDVIARDDLTKRIESGELTGPEARKFAADFRKMIAMKKRLSRDEMSDENREKLQGEYDDLLGNYFQINEDKESKEK